MVPPGEYRLPPPDIEGCNPPRVLAFYRSLNRGRCANAAAALRRARPWSRAPSEALDYFKSGLTG